MKQPVDFFKRVAAFAASQLAFRVIVGLFIIEAVWIALSGRYPMAFDEDFHLGIIRIYAHHLNPFLHVQPAGADTYGAVARDPSYLYQYLMSFPYRLISVFTHNQTVQVISLRFINIALFATSLPLFKRLLQKTGAGDAVVHICLAVFILLPVVPLMASQINYDNAFVPLTALALLLTLRVVEPVKNKLRLNTMVLLQLAIVCLLTSLVKYAFLPVFGAIVLYLALKLKRSFGFRALPAQLMAGWHRLSQFGRYVLLVVLLVSVGLFVQRDGINLVRYHTPVPTCDQVLTVKQCSAYGPWIRDYTLNTTKGEVSDSPITFTGDWLYGMWLRLFFSVDGPGTQFQSRVPLLLPGLAGMVFSVIGVLAATLYWRNIRALYSRNVLALFVLSAGLYVLALWLDEYKAFIRTGQPVAINGRYLLPFMLPFFLIVAFGYIELLKHRQRLLSSLSVVILACFIIGGGTLTYVLRSNDDWYWPSGAVRSANHAVKKTVGPLTPGYKTPTAFLGRFSPS